MVGVAVKVTGVPAQIGVTGVVIVTAGIAVGVTVIGGAVKVAMVGEAQVALEVMITLTISPVTKELFEYVLELAPTLIPLSCH